jgi:hypothetical protein
MPSYTNYNDFDSIERPYRKSSINRRRAPANDTWWDKYYPPDWYMYPDQYPYPDDWHLYPDIPEYPYDIVADLLSNNQWPANSNQEIEGFNNDSCGTSLNIMLFFLLIAAIIFIVVNM